MAPRNYARWCKSSIEENEFVEKGIDFTEVFINEEHKGHMTSDYKLTVSFAKKLCMTSKTEKGEQARDYFIKVEDVLKEQVQNNSLPQVSQAELILQLAQSNVKLEKRIEANDRKITLIERTVQESQTKLETTLKTFSAPSTDTWKNDMEDIINDMVNAYSLNPIGFRGKLYKEMDYNGICLNNRLLRMRKRLKKQGVTYRDQMAVTKLDIISKDKQLRSIFEGIVKKYQVLYGTQN